MLLEAALPKTLTGVLDVADALASMGKDRQKQWCVIAEGFVRKMFVTSQGLESIAFLNNDEKEFIERMVPRIKETFYSRAADALDAALRLLDSNVSAKLIFADLANRFYLYI